MNAALAAEAASQRFWEIHDLLFENQQQFDKDLFSKLARKLGLDQDQFQTDFTSESTLSKVNADFNRGLHSGVNGTPSFFIDNYKIELRELSYDAFSSAIDEHMNVTP